MKEWKLVEKVQKLRPGWRFGLLGGDSTMGYHTNKNGTLKRNNKGNIMVAEGSSLQFGWQAEFFGEADPRKDIGQRHATGRGRTPGQAIKEACEVAMRRIEQSEKKTEGK